MKLVFWIVLGTLLGPTVFAVPLPLWLKALAPWAGSAFLFLSGLELKLTGFSESWKNFSILLAGCFLFPFAIGWSLFPHQPFMAVAMAISALPVVIQILKEKNLYQTSLGIRVVALASVCDIIAWIFFAFLLPTDKTSSWIFSHLPVLAFFAGFALGRFYQPKGERGLKYLQNYLLVPLFFVVLGWNVNFLKNFSWQLALIVFGIACGSKWIGTFAAALWTGSSRPEAMTLGYLLNARGAMEIFAAQYALQAGIISGELFAALVLTALATSLLAAFKVRRISAS